MRRPRSLRGRVAVLATASVAIVLGVVGTVLVATFAGRERARLDRSLAVRPPHSFAPSLADRDRFGEQPGQGAAPPVRLRAERGFVRVMHGDAVLLSADAPAKLPPPRRLGYRTVTVSGESYRSLTRATATGDVLETGASLTPLEERIDRLRALTISLSVAALMLTAGLAWWVAGLALRPLRGLRSAVARVSSTRDLSTRLPEHERIEEIDSLSKSVNGMLARLERSAAETEEALEATRRFAADAGHELRTPMTALRANLDLLARNPDMPEAERRAALADARAEAEASIRLLSSLQTLARGDAGAALPREQVDLAELVDAEVERARRRHPHVDFRLRAPETAAMVEGWPDGLRSLVANLLENAAVHGRSDGSVEVTLERERVAEGDPGAAGRRGDGFEVPVAAGVGTPGADPGDRETAPAIALGAGLGPRDGGGTGDGAGPGDDGGVDGSRTYRDGADHPPPQANGHGGEPEPYPKNGYGDPPHLGPRNRHGWRFTVDDDGPGVPSPDRERIFERFVRADDNAGGSGLGLALVRQQARLQGGDAWVEESPLGGARFVARLARDAGAD